MGEADKQKPEMLVRAAQNGDTQALRELLVANWGWLKGLVYSIVGDVDEAEDVLQEICVRAISRIGTLRDARRFRGWLATLARHAALQWHRTKRRRHRCQQLQDQWTSRDSEGPCWQQLAKQEQMEQLMQAVQELDERYRQVFMLAYSDNLSYREIAEILGVTVTTVQIRLVRARRMLYDKLGQEL